MSITYDERYVSTKDKDGNSVCVAVYLRDEDFDLTGGKEVNVYVLEAKKEEQQVIHEAADASGKIIASGYIDDIDTMLASMDIDPSGIIPAA